MKRFAGLAVLIIMVACIAGCAGDVFVEPPPSLSGTYIGTYSYQQGEQSPVVQEVVWVFTTDRYFMELPETDPAPTREFCDVVGTYSLSANVDMELINGNLNQDICDESKDPEGTFSLNQSVAGRVLMKQVNGDITIEIEIFIE